jgi:hypothetical protein
MTTALRNLTAEAERPVVESRRAAAVRREVLPAEPGTCGLPALTDELETQLCDALARRERTVARLVGAMTVMVMICLTLAALVWWQLLT